MMIWLLGVGVAGAVYLGVVGSSFGFLGGGSRLVRWAGFGRAGSVVCLLRLGVLGREWSGVLWVLCLDSARCDLRVGLVCGVGFVCVIDGQGRVRSVLLRSCIVCGMDGSSSPVRV